VRDDGSLSRRAIYGGASLLVLIVFAILGLILARLLAGYITADDSGERDKVSLQAIAQAKAGLIAYARGPDHHHRNYIGSHGTRVVIVVPPQ